MGNLLNFFFSFDKLMKEKLVIAFFWLSIIVFGLWRFSDALSAIKLGPLAGLVNFINFFGFFLLGIVALRLLSEVCVAVFRINDNLSPDGGRSETADIDPIVEARKAAEAAAKRAKEMSQTAAQRTSTAAKNLTDSGDTDVEDAVEVPAPKRRGRPKGSKNKATATKKAATKTAATGARKKPGPKPGSKRKVSKDGVRLKKDGTPAKKPGPKSK